MYSIIREVYEYTSIDNQQQAHTLLVAIYSVQVGVCGGSHVLLDIDVYICYSEPGSGTTLHTFSLALSLPIV